MRDRKDQAPPSSTQPVPRHGVWQWVPSAGSGPRGRGCPPVNGTPSPWALVEETDQYSVVLIISLAADFFLQIKLPRKLKLSLRSSSYLSESIHGSANFSRTPAACQVNARRRR